MTSKAALK